MMDLVLKQTLPSLSCWSPLFRQGSEKSEQCSDIGLFLFFKKLVSFGIKPKGVTLSFWPPGKLWRLLVGKGGPSSGSWLPGAPEAYVVGSPQALS